MANRLSGKVALISGGASGIGAATARRFIAEGAKVMIGDIDEEKGKALSRSLGTNADFCVLDVRDEHAWRAAVDATQVQFSPLTTLINSAGISVPSNIESTRLEAFREMCAVNLDGVFLGCQSGVNVMKSGSGGAIVNIGSTMGLRGRGELMSYCAAKGGVLNLSRAVAEHCATCGYDIRVNVVTMGAIHTEMVERYIADGQTSGLSREDVITGFSESALMKRLGTPEEAANAILFLASDEASFMTGSDIAVEGGFLV